MIENRTTPAVINGGVTPITLERNPSLTRNLISFSGRSTGVISFRTKSIFSDYQVPGTPNSINLANNKSISFDGEALEAIELTDAGSGNVTVCVTQYQA
jgi:hypothetical protein